MQRSFLIGFLFFFVAIALCKEPYRVRVVSDLHIGSGWLGPQERHDALHRFFEETNNSDIDHLVLLGDIFDLWFISLYTVPPNPEDILNSHEYHGVDVRSYVDDILRVAESGHKVSYITGNHDMEMSKGPFNNVFDGKVIHEGDKLDVRGISFTHGHEVDMWNSIEPHTTKERRPMGYLATRSAATIADEDEFHPDAPGLLYIICPLLPASYGKAVVELFKHENIFEAFYAEVVNVAINGTLGDRLHHVVAGANPYFTDHPEMELIEWIKEYKDVVVNWVFNYTEVDVSARIMADCHNYRYFIERSKYPVMIRGHTHKPEIIKLQKRDEDSPAKYLDGPDPDVFPAKFSYSNNEIIYANSGTTIQEHDEMTYLDLTFEWDEMSDGVQLPTRFEIFDILTSSRIEHLYNFGPNLDEAKEHMVHIGGVASFDSGRPVEAAIDPKKSCEVISLYTLAILSRSGVLTNPEIAPLPSASSVEWKGSSWTVNVGLLTVEDECLIYKAANACTPIEKLAEKMSLSV